MNFFRILQKETKINFVYYRQISIVLSCVFLLLSSTIIGICGINWGIDFAGGVLMEIETYEVVPLNKLRTKLKELDIGSISIQNFGSNRLLLIRFNTNSDQTNETQIGIEKIRNAIDSITKNFRRIEMVGPSISDELKTQAIWAILISILILKIYIWLRFEWQFSIGAILALLHDIILTISFYAITQIEFNLSSVAALLTIAGYSINDTMVIYDRVREDIIRFKTKSFFYIVDHAINATLSRTMMTSITTLSALIILAIFGGVIIRDFVLALIFGVIVGTYSSIFLASFFLLLSPPKYNISEYSSEK